MILLQAPIIHFKYPLYEISCITSKDTVNTPLHSVKKQELQEVGKFQIEIFFPRLELKFLSTENCI